MGFKLWDKVYGRGDPKAYWADPLPPTSMLLVAEREPPGNSEALIAAEMAELQARAVAVGGSRRIAGAPRALVMIFAVMLLLGSGKHVARVIDAAAHGRPWTGDLGSILTDIAIMTAAMLLATMLLRSQVNRWKRFCSQLATALCGKAGLDGLSDVASWLATRWRWFLPPELGVRDVMWAEGSRRGFPVLIVMEHEMAGLGAGILTSRMSGARGTKTAGQVMRTSFFIQGARLRDAEHRARVVQRLDPAKGGVVQCPPGLYLYTTYVYGGMHDDPEEDIAGWMSFLDMVIDPSLAGTPGPRAPTPGTRSP